MCEVRRAYCLQAGEGYLPARYRTREDALRAARRRVRMGAADCAVVWCDVGGVPKVWLARVRADGTVERTQYWE